MAQQLINIGASPNDGTGTKLRPAGTIINENFTELYNMGNASGASASTGVIEFGGLSINGGDNTKFDVGIVKGWIIDNTTDPENPVQTFIDVAAQTLISPAFLATDPVTFITMDSAGVIAQRNVPPTATQRRDELSLGVVVHSDNIIINAINNLPVLATAPLQQMVDIFQQVGIFNGGGNDFIYNGSNLNINKSEGDFVSLGVNYESNPKNPHVKTLGVLNALTFRYRNQNSVEGLDTTLIDPNTYDNAGVDTAVPVNKWTVQRINIFSSNIVRIQKGQAIYNSKSEAQQALAIDPFLVESNIASNGLHRAFLIVKEGATDLSDSGEACFLSAPKFQNTGGSASGTSATLWSPTALTLGDGFANGATVNLNTGAGMYVNFAQGNDDEYVFNVSLDRNGVSYDGSGINVKLYWMKFGASGGTVGWELDYAFVELGDNAFSKVDGNLSDFVDVTSLNNQELTSTTFTTISGNSGSKALQLTLRRNSLGGGSDTYSGEAELYGFNIEI